VDGSGVRRYVDSGTALDLTILARTKRLEPLSASVGTKIDNAIPFNVKDAPYGAVGDGVTNDLTAIQAAIDAASALYVATAIRQTVLAPKGSYVITGGSITIPEGVTLVGAYVGATRLIQGDSTHWIVRARGTEPGSDLTTLASNATAGASTIAVTSATGIAVGDYFLLGDDSNPFTDRPFRKGEIVRIKSIVGTTLTLGGQLSDSYATASSAGIKKLTMLDQVGLEHVTLVNPSPGTHLEGLLELFCTRRAKVHMVDTQGADEWSIQISNSIDFSVDVVRHLDHTDDTGNGRWGYGVEIQRASRNGSISNVVGRRVRHLITAGGVDNVRGFPRDVTVSNCAGSECTSTVFDTHNCENFSFSNCTATGSYAGFNMRGRGTKLTGCTVEWVDAYGVNFNPDSHGSKMIGGSVKRVLGGHGVIMGGDDTEINGVTIRGTGWAGVMVDTTPRSKIKNCTIFNTGILNATYKAPVCITDTATPGLIIDGNLLGYEAYTGDTAGMGGAATYTEAIWSGGNTPTAVIVNNKYRGVANLVNVRRTNFTYAGNINLDNIVQPSVRFGYSDRLSSAATITHGANSIHAMGYVDAANNSWQSTVRLPPDARPGGTLTLRVWWGASTNTGDVRLIGTIESMASGVVVTSEAPTSQTRVLTVSGNMPFVIPSTPVTGPAPPATSSATSPSTAPTGSPSTCTAPTPATSTPPPASSASPRPGRSSGPARPRTGSSTTRATPKAA
jgi:hypothetical protein